jgi:3-oxoacyl-[acyl-carrier-protein] synthase III
MERCVREVLAASGTDPSGIARYYLHQANKRLVDGFVAASGLPSDKVAMHMDRYGNTSAAGTLILLAEDLDAGTVRIGSGDAVLFAAIGAGIHYGAHVVRL